MSSKKGKNSKGRKNAKKKRLQRALTVALVIALVLLLVVLWKIAVGSGETKKQADGQMALEFPYSLDDGKLAVDSLFQSSIANPDCNDEIGEDIATVEVWNQSEQFLASAQITAILEDGTELVFEIQDVPAGGKVWAFETSNKEIPAQPVCESMKCKTSYEETMPVMEKQVQVKASGTDITISNLTGEDLTGLNVSFHCLFDGDVYYGGKTCTYPIEALPAGENTSLSVQECYLGTAEAVRVTQK